MLNDTDATNKICSATHEIIKGNFFIFRHN